MISIIQGIPNHIYFNLIDLVDIDLVKLFLLNKNIDNINVIPKKTIVSTIVFIEYLLYLLLTALKNDRVMTKIILQIYAKELKIHSNHFGMKKNLCTGKTNKPFDGFRKGTDIVKDITQVLKQSDEDYVSVQELMASVFM